MSSAFDSVMETKRPDYSGESFVEHKKEIYKGIPTNTKSKMLDYALSDEDGERMLSFLLDDSTINFKLNHPKEDGAAITAKRLPDAERADFGSRGNTTKGRFQLHKSSPSSIYGTIQGGKKTMTFALEGDDSGSGEWKVIAKKHPDLTISDLVNSVKTQEKKAFKLPDIDTVTAPLTADYSTALPLAAAVGATIMGAKNVGMKIWKKINGEYDDGPSLGNDIVIGGLGGTLIAGGAKLFGESGGNKTWELPRLNYTQDKYKPWVFDELPRARDMAKVSSMQKEADNIDIARIQNLLSYDYSLTMMDRKILMQQLQQAMSLSQNGQIDVNRLKNSGLGMLIGYIAAKAMGFGMPMAMGAAALGGMIGYTPKTSGPKYDTRGFYTY